MRVDPETIIQTADLPSIPTVLSEVLSMADNPSATSADLEKIVARDPALISQLLKVVNSSFYSFSSRVSSVSHAMILLGFSTVKSISSGMMLMNVFDDLVGVSKEMVATVWSHCLRVANISKILADSESIAVKDDIFLAGMIHDMGHLVLSQYFSKKYANTLGTTSLPEPEWERYLLGIDHAEIAALLLEKWQFPEPVIELVRFHHKPDLYTGAPRAAYYLAISDQIIDLDMKLSDNLARGEEALNFEEIDLLNHAGLSWAEIKSYHAELEEALSVVA